MKSSAVAPISKNSRKPGTISLAIFLTFLAFTLLATNILAQTPGHTAFSRDLKPADPNFILTREVFDCTAQDTFFLNPTSSITQMDSTIDGSRLLNTYSCRAWNEEGPETIYRLDVITDLELFAGLRDLGAVDLDIFLLDDCDTETCLTSDNTEFSIQLAPGTYYLVVDGYGKGSELPGSTYTLLIDCRWPGIPTSICLEGGTTPVSCATEIITLAAQLFEKPNYVQTYDCSPDILRGGEHWFAVSLEALHGFTVSTASLSASVDQALWLFDGCGAEATCLGYADDKNAGQGETLSFTNELETAITVYLATDSFRVVENETTGALELNFDCQSFVANDAINMGSLKAMYR